MKQLDQTLAKCNLLAQIGGDGAVVLKVLVGSLVLLMLCGCTTTPTPPTPKTATSTASPVAVGQANPNPTATPKSELYWGSDRLEHYDDGLIEQARAEDVVLRDFEVEATFFNPYPTEKGAWDYGFFFRDEEENRQFWLVIQSGKTWELLNRPGDDSPINHGILPELDISDEGSNHIRLIAEGALGKLYVNKVFVTDLDLSARMNFGYIGVETGFYNESEIEGEATRYRDFIIRSINESPVLQTLPPKPNAIKQIQVHTKAGNSLAHEDDGVSVVDFAGQEISDFLVEATFFTPYSTETGAWDYGFVFRHQEPKQEFRLIIRSDKSWLLTNHSGDDSTQINKGSILDLDIAPDGSNHIALIAKGDNGYLYLNNQFVAGLDLSARTNAGDIGVATEMLQDSGIAGQATHYEQFMIWSILQD